MKKSYDKKKLFAIRFMHAMTQYNFLFKLFLLVPGRLIESFNFETNLFLAVNNFINFITYLVPLEIA